MSFVTYLNGINSFLGYAKTNKLSPEDTRRGLASCVAMMSGMLASQFSQGENGTAELISSTFLKVANVVNSGSIPDDDQYEDEDDNENESDSDELEKTSTGDNNEWDGKIQNLNDILGRVGQGDEEYKRAGKSTEEYEDERIEALKLSESSTSEPSGQ